MPEKGDYLRDICEWSGESMSATPFTFLGQKTLPFFRMLLNNEHVQQPERLKRFEGKQ